LQAAVGIAGGNQIIRDALRTGMAADPGCVTLQVERSNAFNTTRRDRMLEAVAQHYPAPAAPGGMGVWRSQLVQGSDKVLASNASTEHHLLSASSISAP
jgi:hypothetical protein